VNHLEENGDLQFALGNALIMESEYQREFKPAYGEAHQRFFTLPYQRRRKEMFLRYPQPIFLQATVFRTSALKDIGGWREDIISDDFSLFLRLFFQLRNVGKDFAYQPEAMTCFYRRHEANVSRSLERQFMTTDQALTHLCPPEWQDAAYLRNFADHAIVAVRRGKIFLTVRFFRTTVAHIGLLRWLLAVGPALVTSLMTILSGRLGHKADVVIAHEPPATAMDYPTDRSCDSVVPDSVQVCR
jgi:hypothetical protein